MEEAKIDDIKEEVIEGRERKERVKRLRNERRKSGQNKRKEFENDTNADESRNKKRRIETETLEHLILPSLNKGNSKSFLEPRVRITCTSKRTLKKLLLPTESPGVTS